MITLNSFIANGHKFALCLDANGKHVMVITSMCKLDQHKETITADARNAFARNYRFYTGRA